MKTRLTSANERGELLLDHLIIPVNDLDRSIAFYETALKPLGIVHALDHDGYSLEAVYKSWQHRQS